MDRTQYVISAELCDSGRNAEAVGRNGIFLRVHDVTDIEFKPVPMIQAPANAAELFRGVGRLQGKRAVRGGRGPARNCGSADADVEALDFLGRGEGRHRQNYRKQSQARSHCFLSKLQYVRT